MLLVLATLTPRVREARLEGPKLAEDRGRTRVLAGLTGAEASPSAVTTAIRALEAYEGVGSIRVRRQLVGRDVDLVFVHDGRALRVSRLEVGLDGELQSEAEGFRIQTRVSAGTKGLTLYSGGRFHPALLDLDVARIRTYYQGRGYREAQVRPEVEVRDDLVVLRYWVKRGLRFRIESVEAIGGLSGGWRVSKGDAWSEKKVEKDRRRLQSRLCRSGRPRAAVSFETSLGERSETEQGIRVSFLADPGPPVTTGTVHVAGRWVPYIIVQNLPLQEGHPYCPLVVEDARETLTQFLRNVGVPDPHVTVHERTRLQPDGHRVTSVTFDIRGAHSARVERIWFTGDHLTRQDVLRQMLALEEGDKYVQSAVDASVQAMRKSGLFKRVKVSVLPGSSDERVYLAFNLKERDPLGFDVLDAQLTVHNVDLTAWPEDYRSFDHGRALRGAGQRMDLYGASNFQGIFWRDDFLTRYFTVRLGGERNKQSKSAFEEIWYTLSTGFGVKAFEGATRLGIFLEGEWTSTDQDEAATDLPVLEGDAFTGATGLEGRLDFARLDDERVRYLGVDFSVQGRVGRSFAGTDFDWADTLARLRTYLPVWKNKSNQHYVVRLVARSRAVFATTAGVLQAHQRLVPKARGYTSSAIGVEFPFKDGTQRLGGLHAFEGTGELRIPLPFGHRNALIPFYDVATVSDELGTLFKEPHGAIGLTFAFSFFSERLEGNLWGAYPLTDASPEYVGVGLGGNF